jgi:hypothetical protein
MKCLLGRSCHFRLELSLTHELGFSCIVVFIRIYILPWHFSSHEVNIQSLSLSHLPVSPLRLLLLRKSLHANLLVLAPKQTMEHPTLELNSLSHAQVLALVDDLLSSLNRNLRIARNRLRSIQRALNAELRSLENSRRKTPVIRVLATEILTRKNKLHSSALPNSTSQTLTAARTRDRTKLNLRLSEVRLNTAIQHIAHHRKLAATSQSVAIDSGDDGLLDERGQLGPGLDEVGAVSVCESFGRHFFDVCAGGEGFFAAGEHHGSDGRVGVEGLEGGVQLGDQWSEEGVEGFGAVDLDLSLFSMIVLWLLQVTVEHTHANTSPRRRDLEELILLFGRGGQQASSQRHDEFAELRGARP